MKRVLIYGDSNTYGFSPVRSDARLPEDIKKAPDEQAIRLLIERIETSPSDDKKSTTVSCIYSTLSTVVGKTGHKG